MGKWLAAVLLMGVSISGQVQAQAHERDAQRIAESEQIQSVRGGATFQVSAAYDVVFDAIVNNLKRTGVNLDSASRDAGQIATAMEVSGGWKQTGKRTIITLIKDSADKTTVRVAISVQKRFKGLQTEPWGDASIDPKASAAAAEQIRSTIETTLHSSS